MEEDRDVEILVTGYQSGIKTEGDRERQTEIETETDTIRHRDRDIERIYSLDTRVGSTQKELERDRQR